MSKKNAQQKSHYVDNKEFFKAMVIYLDEVKSADESGDPRPRIPNYIGECFMKIANHLSYKPNFINYCVDETTEILTNRGWQLHGNLTDMDEVLSCDPLDGTLKWSKVLDVFRNHVDEQLFHLTGCGLDAMVTVGHRWLTEESGLIKTEKLRSREHIITMGCAERGAEVTSYLDSFVNLVGWSVTEGHYVYGKNTHAVRIAQKKEQHVNNIRKLLIEVGARFKEYDQNGVILFHITGDVANELIAVAPTPRKVISPQFILSLTQSQRNDLINTMIDGDGWRIYRDSGNVSRQYCQKDKNHVDSFVMLCTLAGISTTTTPVSFNTPYGHYDGYTVTLRSKTKVHIDNIDFHGGRVKLNKYDTTSHYPTVSYSGIVWCPKTEYGTFVARRNGKVYVTGNTYRDDMISDGVENCCQYIYNFNPEKTENPFAYFTQIIWYAFLRRIQKEKRQLYVKYKAVELLDLEDAMLEGGHHRNTNILEEHAARNEFIKNYEESMRVSREKQKQNKASRIQKIKDESAGSALFGEGSE